MPHSIINKINNKLNNYNIVTIDSLIPYLYLLLRAKIKLLVNCFFVKLVNFIAFLKTSDISLALVLTLFYKSSTFSFLSLAI